MASLQTQNFSGNSLPVIRFYGDDGDGEGGDDDSDGDSVDDDGDDGDDSDGDGGDDGDGDCGDDDGDGGHHQAVMVMLMVTKMTTMTF